MTTNTTTGHPIEDKHPLASVEDALNDCRAGYQYIRDTKTAEERAGIGYERCIAAAEAAITALREYMAGHDKLTDEMINAGADAVAEHIDNPSNYGLAEAIFRSMIAASPSYNRGGE